MLGAQGVCTVVTTVRTHCNKVSLFAEIDVQYSFICVRFTSSTFYFDLHGCFDGFCFLYFGNS